MKASVHCVLLAAGLNGILLAGLHASEIDSLLLFHESDSGTVEQDQSEPTQSNTLQQEPSSVLADNTKPDRSASLKITYLYNGFISSENGMHYFVNNTPVTQLNSIELVSVTNGGRTLELETKRGLKFSLSIGDTRLVVTRVNDLPSTASNPAGLSTKAKAGNDVL